MHVFKCEDYETVGEYVEVKDKAWTEISRTSTYYSEDAESGINYYTLAHDGLTKEELTEIVEYHYIETHCQHSYDCCGNVYTGRGKLLFSDDKIAFVEQSWLTNI